MTVSFTPVRHAVAYRGEQLPKIKKIPSFFIHQTWTNHLATATKFTTDWKKWVM